MNRRKFMAVSALLAAPSILLPRSGFATSRGVWTDPQVSDAQLIALLHGWLDAFNADDATSYRAFIAKYLPDGLPYLDDDLAVRDATGGFDLLRTELTYPNQITGWVKDRSWDRFSRVILTAKDPEHLSDISFRGAPAPTDFSIARLTEQNALRTFDSKLHSRSIRNRAAQRLSCVTVGTRWRSTPQAISGPDFLPKREQPRFLEPSVLHGSTSADPNL